MLFRVRFFLAVVLGGSLLVQAQADKPSEEDLAGNKALAERVSQTAQFTLAGGAIDPSTLRESAALFEAANKLNPTEPRFLRLLAEDYVQLGGSEGRNGAISALTRYLVLQPADLGAQRELIDLHYGQMDTAEARKKYIDQLLKTDQLAAEVRSHVAVQGAILSAERTDLDASQKYTEQALSLFPLNPAALRLKYQQMDSQTPIRQRVHLLLQMLRANPAQTGVMAELASDLANAGLVDPAMSWYQQSFGLQQRTGQTPPVGQLNAYVCELVIADQLTTADPFAHHLVDIDPTNSDAAFVSLLIDRRGGNADKIQASAEKVRTAINTRLSRISDYANSRESATTQPSAPVDTTADVKTILGLNNPRLAGDYAAGLSDLAWLEISLNSKPADAQQYVTLLRQLLPADSVVLARLDGWTYLIDGKNDEARVKLSAVADRDPLSALGLMRTDSKASADQTIAAAKKLLNQNAAGLVGALLMESFRDKLGLMPPGPDAAGLSQELDQFPKEWLDFLDFSRVHNFYTLKAETERVAHPYGVPMIATVTVTNSGKYDITIGTDGALRPDLWFDVQVRGIAQQAFPGIAFDRLTPKLVLHPRETMSTTVRVDQGPLSMAMQSNPAVAQPLYFSVVTNPLTQQGGVAPGPGGYRATMRVVERSPAPLSISTLQGTYNQLNSSAADVRIRTLELLGAYARGLKQAENEELKTKGTEITDVIRKSTGDPVAAVRAQASLITAALSDASVREGIVRSMTTASSFQERVVGMMAVQQLIDQPKRAAIVQTIADADSDPIIKRLAQGVVDVSKLPAPTTQPATEPSQPVAAP